MHERVVYYKSATTAISFLESCGGESYDMFIMVDGSIAENVNFAKVKEFLTNFVNGSNVSPSGSRIGLLQFSLPHLASLEIMFQDSQVKSYILEKISSLYYQEGDGRYTGKALEAVDSWVRVNII